MTNNDILRLTEGIFANGSITYVSASDLRTRGRRYLAIQNENCKELNIQKLGLSFVSKQVIDMSTAELGSKTHVDTVKPNQTTVLEFSNFWYGYLVDIDIGGTNECVKIKLAFNAPALDHSVFLDLSSVKLLTISVKG